MKMVKLGVFFLLFTLYMTSSSFAQFKNWSKAFQFDLSASMLKSQDTGTSLDGYFVSGAFEQISFEGEMAGGVRFGYLSTKEEPKCQNCEMTEPYPKDILR